jgi:hypothetical protein
MSSVRGGEHRAGLVVVRRDVDHHPDDVAPLLGDLEVGDRSKPCLPPHRAYTVAGDTRLSLAICSTFV